MNRLAIPLSQDNPLWISWHDTTWIPILNPGNVMDYFQEKSNPFYDRTCNNEIIKMQRVGIEQLNNMTGREYILLHVQEPILYVIRKQHRHSPSEVTPMADYYIIAGTVYQAPDLANVFNSRLLTITQHLQSSFEETSVYSRYHPNKGYSWDFSSNKALADKSKAAKKDTDKAKEEPSSFFQRKRVDMLLGELLNKFPLPMPPQSQAAGATNASGAQATATTTAAASATTTSASSTAAAPKTSPVAVTNGMAQGTGTLTQSQAGNSGDNESSDAVDIKQEHLDMSPHSMSTTDNNGDSKLETSDMKPPPEKKTKLM